MEKGYDGVLVPLINKFLDFIGVGYDFIDVWNSRKKYYSKGETQESDYGYWGSETAKTNKTSRGDYPNWQDRWALSTGLLANIFS